MSDEPDTDPEFDDEFGPGAGASRGWKVAAAVAVVAALASVAVLVILLLGGSSDANRATGEVRACILDLGDRDFTKDGSGAHPTGRNCPPADAKRTDGLVTRTDDGGFTIRRIVDGTLDEGTVELHVRAPDRPYIDIAHAQTHAALGQPIRVYTERIDGRDSVVYMEDAPLLK
jgi:hypothetical protein